MYYCPNCKKKFRQYRRRCPICGGTCRHNDNRAIMLIVAVGVLFLLLIGLIILMGSTGSVSNETSGSSSLLSSSPESSGTEGSSVSSTPPESSVPPVSSAPPASSNPPASSAPTTSTPATSPSVSGLGIYTRAELEAMDKTYSASGFGAGRGQNHARPDFPVSEQKKYGQYDAYFVAEDTNTVYLTFDCGYEYYATDANGNKYPVTGKILDVLKEKGVKAVFFITEDYVRLAPDLVQRMIDEGHIVGNHTVNHPVMPAQTIDRMEKEIMDLHNIVLEKYGYKMTLFRPPTGAYSVQSLAVVKNLGYKTVLWSFQHYDYDTENQPSDKTAYNTIVNNSHNGAIFLLHAISEANANVLGDVIDTLRNEQNYTIGVLS